MIYRQREREPYIQIFNEDYKNRMHCVNNNTIIVTDPPFNIGYHYNEYKDRMDDDVYYHMLAEFVKSFPCVLIHYPEALYKISVESGIVPSRVCSWIYNSNTARQHRDIAFYGISPDFTRTLQPYKNPKDKRIQERIARGKIGCKMYDWWYVNQVKNVSKEKTKHPCQMPLEVMKNVISTLPNDKTIFDPFMGSGTTAIACIELGYDFIGCEINNEYYEIAKRRIDSSIKSYV